MMACSLQSIAGETRTAEAEGVAAIQGNARNAARDSAVEDAQKRVVEQVIDILIDRQTRIENYQLISDKILSQAGGYIKRYTITRETVDSGLLRVRIKAEVALGRLTGDLSDVGIHPGRARNLRSVTITVTGLNKDQYVKFKNVLRNQVRAVKDLRERSFSGTTARISVESQYSVQILSDELLLRDFGTFTVEVTGSTANALELNVTAK
jgi:hypothetical protein